MLNIKSKILPYAGAVLTALTMTAMAQTVNISSLVDFATQILNNQTTWLGLVLFGVIITVYRIFGNFFKQILTFH